MDPSDPPSVLFVFLLASPATSLIFSALGIVVLLGLSGLISGSEVAFFALTDNDYDELEQANSAPGRILLKVREQPRILLATILIANNFINIAIVLVSELIVRSLLTETTLASWAGSVVENLPLLTEVLTITQLASLISFVITVVGVTFLLVLFGEVAPKVYATYNRVSLASRMAIPISFLMRIFYPISFLLVRGALVIERRLESHTLDAATASQEDIDEAIELTVNRELEGEDGLRQDVDILKRIVHFNNVTVRQVMRSRQDVTAVDEEISYQELLDLIRESSYSRIPVYREDFDKVSGLLYVKDLLGHRHEKEDFAWQQLVRREVLFIPETKKISDLLKNFQQEKMHLAIVVDEYGGTEGIVTLEDVLEEVIGDIHDEFDEEDQIIFQRIDDLNYVFDGKTLLNDVYRVLKLPTSTFEDVKGEAESLAGLLLETLGRFPEKDQEFEFEQYRFRVMAVSKRRIEEILITLPEEAEQETE